MGEEALIQCTLCHHGCRLAPGDVGFCRSRTNRNGTIKPLGYGCLTSLALDPIEKKPLARFHPGSLILSAGSFGCNFRCPFCQNHTISQRGREVTQTCLTPAELASLAVKLAREEGNVGLAFTYNEPLISLEYVRDTASLIKKAGLLVVLVTNGGIRPKPFTTLLPLVDAMNIDLKGFSNAFYEWVGGNLDDVKENIRSACQAGIHVELTTLVIPGRNDGPDEMEAEASWIASLSPTIPLHLSRYFPRWHCSDPMTPDATLLALQRIAKRHLQYVYLGNW